MAALKFKQNDEGEDVKEAVGMYSKENEYVDFDKICDCQGQVKILCQVYF
jgi:dynein heavy chain